jgi:hypothetical protein
MDRSIARSKVAAALLHFIEIERLDRTCTFKAADVAKAAEIYNVRLVTGIIAALGLSVAHDGEVNWNEPALPQLTMEAYLTPEPVGSATTNTIHNHGDNNQMAAGGDVTGTLNVTISYEQVLNQLVRDIEKSNLPDEKKSGIIQATKALLKEGALQGFKVTVGELIKHVYANSHNIAELTDKVGHVL